MSKLVCCRWRERTKSKQRTLGHSCGGAFLVTFVAKVDKGGDKGFDKGFDKGVAVSRGQSCATSSGNSFWSSGK